MGFTAFGGAAFFGVPVFGICPVNRLPLAFSVLSIEAKELLKYILPDMGGQKAIHGNKIGFFGVKGTPVTGETLFLFDLLKPPLGFIVFARFYERYVKLKQIVSRNFEKTG